MRIALLVAAMTLSTGFAQAFEHRAPIAKPLYACGQGGVTRVATVDAKPGQCCEGQLSCTQFLATRSILKPALDPRT